MKKMKLAAIFAGLVSVFTFSSCLNDGDSGPNYDLYEIVTVEDGSIFGGPVLKGDAWGYTYELQWLQVYWPVLRHLMAVITSVCR